MDCVNQLERDLIRMHQREGIELAKKEGGISVKQICEITNVSRATLYKKLSEGNQ
jgi:DNA invertase Pin-like site-specific DNA recombinase